MSTKKAKIKFAIILFITVLLTLGLSVSFQAVLANILETAGTSVHLGSPTLILDNNENMFWGEVSNSSSGTGSFILLQKNGDKFRIDHNGNVVAAGNITTAGQNVCRQDGTNCPADANTDTWITTQTCSAGQYLSSVGKTAKTCTTPPNTTDCSSCDGRFINVGETGDSILDGTIDSSEIEDNTLTAFDLAANSVGNSEMIDSPTFTDVYATSWFRNDSVNEGLYNSATASYFYSQDTNFWAMDSNRGLIFRDGYNGPIQGYTYYDDSGNFGSLSPDGSWSVRTNNTDTYLYETVRLGSSASDSHDVYLADKLYDWDNTSYYIDPNGTSVLDLVYTFGNMFIGSSPADGADLYIGNRLYDWDNTAYYLDPDSVSVLNAISTNGYIYSGSYLSTPIYYDSNNTSYYVNPAGTSNFNIVNAASYTGGSCDVAERYDATLSEVGELSPGTIVSIDQENELKIKKSRKAYDTSVIGVISTNALITLGTFEDSNDSENPPVALIGRVPTKVTNENGPIKIGDLIVSSSKPGYGMKCDDSKKCQGAVIGKALQIFNENEGSIEVFLKDSSNEVNSDNSSAINGLVEELKNQEKRIENLEKMIMELQND